LLEAPTRSKGCVRGERVLHLRQKIHSTRIGGIALGLKFLGSGDSGMNLDLP